MGTGHRKAARVLERVLEADRKRGRRLMRVWPGVKLLLLDPKFYWTWMVKERTFRGAGQSPPTTS